MKRLFKYVLTLLLTLFLTAAIQACHADYFSPYAFTVNGTQVETEELESAMKRALIEAVLDCASRGYAYDIMDHLNIIDELSKVMFDMEMDLVIREQAQLNGITLDEDDRARAQEAAHEAMEHFLEIASSESVMPFMPAGAYERRDNDPQGNLNRYLESFDLTEAALYEDEVTAILDEKLCLAAAGDLAGKTEEEKLVLFSDLHLLWYNDADIRENGVATAEVVLSLTQK